MPQSGLAVSWLDEGNDGAEAGASLRGEVHAATLSGDTGARANVGVPGRRTITITGHGAVDRLHPPTQRRRPGHRPHERPGFRPDRTAMWAVLLCVLMILAAATSSHASTPRAGAAHGARTTTIAPLHGPRVARSNHT